MLQKYITLFLCLLCLETLGQTQISGRVTEVTDNKETPIPGASVVWNFSVKGTLTDADGNFNLPVPDSLPGQLLISYLGYTTDTILITNFSPVRVVLKKSIDLKELEVRALREDIVISTINPLNAEKITSHELLKAACCNLSEAFETNPSVNVDYKDAVTGIKEIQLLGLGGIYAQMLNENIPDMRGLAGIYGLTYIPGPWIESIQLTKGSGSVLNGYESTTGQINVELKKPMSEETPRFFLNLFGEESGAAEANLHYKKALNKKWSSMLFLHGRRMQNEIDGNNDGFMDTPDNRSINIYNRWQYHSNKKLEGQLSLKFLKDDIEGGQVESAPTTPLYKTNVNTMRAEISGKVGIIYPEKPSKSIGNIYQFTFHDMKSNFGKNTYNARESSIYLQSIYQNTLGELNHEYKFGVTYRFNQLEETFPGRPAQIIENIPGVFVEYIYKYFDKMTLVTGVREDLQPGQNWIFTPRFHGKYNFTENFIFRLSAGRSYRNPYPLADHLSILSSSRQIVFLEEINPERAWNYGVNLTKRGKMGNREFTLSADFYRTDFINQLIVDTYSDSTRILFYNLKGDSYSNSFQVTMNAEIIDKLNFRIAYKIDDVQATFDGKISRLPLIARDRALATASYSASNDHWKFDYTVVWEGRKKLQNVFSDSNGKTVNYSPSFVLMNFQVTKVFRKFELYAGSENLTDYRQEDPIIHPENPFGNSFDATNIWGPIQGRRIYAGMRMSIR